MTALGSLVDVRWTEGAILVKQPMVINGVPIIVPCGGLCVVLHVEDRPEVGKVMLVACSCGVGWMWYMPLLDEL